MFYKQVTLFLQLYILDQHNLQLSSKTHTQKLYVDKTVKAYGPDFCYVRLNQKKFKRTHSIQIILQQIEAIEGKHQQSVENITNQHIFFSNILISKG